MPIVAALLYTRWSIKGVELGLVYFPDYLPWYFDGLGTQGSLTVLSSSQNTPQTDALGNMVSQLKQGDPQRQWRGHFLRPRWHVIC